MKLLLDTHVFLWLVDGNPNLTKVAEVALADPRNPTNEIGSRDPVKGHAAFMPHERSGGGNDPAGGLTLDSGVFNPELLGTLPGNKEWAKARLRDRMDATFAHEHEEARRGGNHVEALRHAPATDLPISEGGRQILRAMQPKEERER